MDGDGDRKALKRKRESCVTWSELVRFWRAATDDELRLFLGFFATKREALEAVARYTMCVKKHQRGSGG